MHGSKIGVAHPRRGRPRITGRSEGKFVIGIYPETREAEVEQPPSLFHSVPDEVKSEFLGAVVHLAEALGREIDARIEYWDSSEGNEDGDDE